MKKYLAFVLALVMILAVTLPVYASKSPERPIKDLIIEAADKDGTDILDEVYLEINDESRKAEAELTNDKIKEILDTDYNEKLVLNDVYDVIYEGGNYPIELKVKQNVAKDDVVFVLTKVNGEWVKVETVIEDGSITFKLDEASVIAFVYEREITEPIPPITGNNVVIVAMIALVCLAGTVYSVKRTVA